MAIDPPAPDPERERLLALLAFSERRCTRAVDKLLAAQRDAALASLQLGKDRAALEAYDEAHPADQPDLFQEQSNG